MFGKSPARFLIAFLALYGVAMYVLDATLPRWTEWQLVNCIPGCPLAVTLACVASRPILAYWWLFLIPVLAILAYFVAVRRNRT